MKMDIVLRPLLLTVIALLGSAAFAAPVTLIPRGSVWRYLDNGSDQGTAWRWPDFNDSTWPSGLAQFGYGDGDEATVVSFGPDSNNKYVTTYFRKMFVVGDFVNLSNLVVRLLRDDGAVVYLNGVEVFRSNMPDGPISYTTLAPLPVGGADETTNYHSAVIPPNLLTFGANLIAVELHQQTPVSADISFDLELLGDANNTPILPVVSVEATDNTASEISPLLDRAEDPAIFRISRTGPTTDSLRVDIALSGAAQNGVDYYFISNRVEIPTGAASVEVVVHVLHDMLVEGTESVQLILLRPLCADNSVPLPGCYTVGASAATASILDDDVIVEPPVTNGTLVAVGSIWKYLDNGSNQGTAWRQNAFDDSTWASGPSQLGYGDGDEATVVGFGPEPQNKYVTTYFRHAFNAPNPAAHSNLLLRVLRDDGVVVYLNGVEVFRNNMPAGLVAFDALASLAVDENTYIPASIPPNALVPGRNVLAAEIHQNSPASSDISFDLELTSDGGTPPPDRPTIEVVALDPQAVEPVPGAVAHLGRLAVRRQGNAQVALQVNFSLSGTATVGADYTTSPTPIVMPAGVMEAYVNIIPQQDNQIEGIETVVFTIEPPACIAIEPPPADCYQVGASSQATVFISDPNTGTNQPLRTIVEVAAIDPNASEVSLNSLGDFGAFAIRRRNNVQTPIEVTFSLSGTAENGVDYNFVSNRVSLAAGMTQRIVTIQPRQDMLVEGIETVVLTIEAPVCPAIAPIPPECYMAGTSNQATVFISDGPSNTNQPPTVSMFTPTSGSSFPAGSNIQLGATASDPEGAAVTVEFFAGANRIGQAPGPSPDGAYMLTWSNVLAGGYSLTARATDSSGRTAVSAPVQISVGGGTGTNSITLIAMGSIWKYLDNGTDQGTAWRQVPFDDSNWAGGPAQLGYGDGDEATVVGFGGNPANKYVTTYFRRSFDLADISGITRLVGKLRQDDGGAVYLNGIEIFRSNLPGGLIAFDTLATMAVEDQIIDFTASPSALVNGRNVIAVEMHQSNVASSDMSFDLELAAERQNSGGTNQAPRVTIVTPANNARFPIGADILLGANATVTTTSHVAALEFFANGVKIGDADGPFLTPAGAWLLTWSNAPAGEFNLTARARDTRGVVGFSAPIRIFVGTNNTPPGVGLFAADAWATEGGANGAIDPGIFRFWREGPTDAPLTVSYSIGGDASNGLDYQQIANTVTFPAGTSVVDVVIRALDDMLDEPTETVVLTLMSNSGYRAGTSNNPAATQGTVHILDNDDVQPNHPPTVRLIRPFDGDVFYQPVDIHLAAMAEDPDGDSLQVEFFANNQRLGSGQFIPGACITCPYYAFTWSNAPAGAYAIAARALDSRGAVTTSAAITITVDGSSVDRELHAVGVYSGDVNGNHSMNHETGTVSVQVNRPDRYVTLVLSSYEPVNWNVTAIGDTTIEKVILGGYYRQTVTGLPPGVQVINRFFDEGHGTSDYLSIGYTSNSVTFLRAVAKLCALTGLDSFSGSYHGVSFTVDRQDDNETYQCDYPQPVDPSQLPNLTFTLSFHGGGSGLFHQNYTLAGPQNGARLLPAMRVVPDAGGRYYYGTESHEMWRFDSQNGAAMRMELGADLPELSWPTGVAFDSQRNRVLLSSLGGEGFLYAYSPAQEMWSLVSSLNNLDTSGVGYHAPNDSIYAVASTYEDYHPRVLHRLDSTGQRVGQIPLPLMPFDFGTGGYETELVSVGEYLVLLIEPGSFFYTGSGQPRESRIYLIDPRNGQVWLTYRRSLVVDTDRDGVPDDRDHCPFTALGTIVDANGCPVGNADTDGDGVTDARDQCPGTPSGSIVNLQGCSLRQLCPCDGRWTNHAQYVDCVIRHTWEFYRQNLITAEQRRQIVGEAVMSNCGRTANEPLCMHLLPQTTEECHRDGLGFILSGDVAGSYIIECTSDFVNWTPIQTQNTAVNGQEILCPYSADAPRFYRLRRQ